jgi:iron complex outermembrane receptor protein
LFFLSQAGWAISPLDLSLEELLNVEVISVSKRPQPVKVIPAAIHVISAEDIQQSGASTIPEALRLAPGVEVLAISHNKWSVSIRGGAREYANKIQVLVDGRSVYLPTFSGVVWEALDVPLESIQRIEVIRGPGAAIWGSNAVSGVINIITKSAEVTLGSKLILAYGDHLRNSVYYRYGFQLSKNTTGRVYAHGFEYDQSRQTSGDPGEDAWNSKGVGFRVDRISPDQTRKFMLQGNAFLSRADDEKTFFSRPPAIEDLVHTQRTQGVNLTGRWENERHDGSRATWQVSFENCLFNPFLLSEYRNTFDGEFTEHLPPGNKHDIIWGAGVRLSKGKANGSKYLRLFDRTHLTEQYRLFLNDEVSLIRDRLNLVLSAGLERNEATGFEFQPSVRLMFTPDEANRYWLGVSRAVRTPSRVEQGARYYFLANPNPPMPYVADSIWQDVDSEKVTSYEAGWRRQIDRCLSLDLTGFYFRYQDGVGSSNIKTILDPAGYVVVERLLNNDVQGDFRGLESVVDWKPSETWQLQGNFRYLDVNTANPPETLAVDLRKNVPVRIFSLFSRLKVNSRINWSAFYRKCGAIEVGDLPGYETVDSMISWKTGPDWSVSLIGQNIFDRIHQEFSPRFLFSKPREFGRQFSLKTEWSF